MPKSLITTGKKPVIPNKLLTSINLNQLLQLAFDNTSQANIITTVSTGKIIMANKAACKLLGYSKKDILTQSRATIFEIKESSFRKMLKQRTAEGESKAMVTVIKKSGKTITCEITSATFTGADGIKKAITTITDRSETIQRQKMIDAKKEKVVASNIALAKSKQKNIDIKKEKEVALNIVLASAKSDERLVETNRWIKYIAKASYDVMWDWDISTNGIYTGDSVEEVFGYTVKDNLIHYSDFIACLLPKEKPRVEKKIQKALASNLKSWNDSFKFICKNGSIASTNCRASIIRDEKGKALRLIGAIQDISKLHTIGKKIVNRTTIESKELFFQIASISFDVIWERDLLTNEVIRGEGLEELLGYPLKEYQGRVSDLSDHIHPDDKDAVEQSLNEAINSSVSQWEHAFRILKADGSIARVIDRATIFRRTDGTAFRMIGAMQNISKQKELEEKLEKELKEKKEYEQKLKIIFDSSNDLIYDVDLATNEVKLSEAYKKEFGYPLKGHMTLEKNCFNHVHPNDKKTVIQAHQKRLVSKTTEWKQRFRFLKFDDSVVHVECSGIILRNADGEAYRIIGSLHDISKQTMLEERLVQEIRLKEKQVADAAEEAKEAERTEIGKELHDNVNQLLGASRLYLELAKRGGVESELYINRSSEYTMEAIEEIRKLTKGLTTDTIQSLGLCEAISNIANHTMEVNHVKISCSVERFIENSVNNKFKLNVYRIIQEQLNNILKHGQAKQVAIDLSQNKKTIHLRITDDGIGFDTGKKQKGIGITNIKSRATTYNGTADFVSQPGKGCVLTVVFPVSDTLLNEN